MVDRQEKERDSSAVLTTVGIQQFAGTGYLADSVMAPVTLGAFHLSFFMEIQKPRQKLL